MFTQINPYVDLVNDGATFYNDSKRRRCKWDFIHVFPPTDDTPFRNVVRISFNGPTSNVLAKLPLGFWDLAIRNFLEDNPDFDISKMNIYIALYALGNEIGFQNLGYEIERIKLHAIKETLGFYDKAKTI